MYNYHSKNSPPVGCVCLNGLGLFEGGTKYRQAIPQAQYVSAAIPPPIFQALTTRTPRDKHPDNGQKCSSCCCAR